MRACDSFVVDPDIQRNSEESEGQSSTSADGVLNTEYVSNRHPLLLEYCSIHSRVLTTAIGAAHLSLSDMPRLAVCLFS